MWWLIHYDIILTSLWELWVGGAGDKNLVEKEAEAWVS